MQTGYGLPLSRPNVLGRLRRPGRLHVVEPDSDLLSRSVLCYGRLPWPRKSWVCTRNVCGGPARSAWSAVHWLFRSHYIIREGRPSLQKNLERPAGL